MLFSMKELHKKVKYEYDKLKNLTCPGLDNEVIFFYRSGYNHLIRKGRKFRSRKEVLRRTGLLSRVVEVVSSRLIEVAIRREEGAIFWELRKRFKDRDIIVVIRQLGTGPKHFFSVMDEKIKNHPSG